MTLKRIAELLQGRMLDEGVKGQPVVLVFKLAVRIVQSRLPGSNIVPSVQWRLV